MCIIPPVYFNSRPSARGDLSGAATARTTIRFQFTPLREGRRMRTCSPTCPLSFQFTPLREGRRRRGACGGPAAVISIHAPPRGATRRVPGLSQHGGNFNSRPSARGDNAEKSDIVMPQDFNSRPSARGDQTTSTSTFAIWRFQFTPLREGRRCRRTGDRGGRHFNSRPSARGDGTEGLFAEAVYYFNSRPSARGDTNGEYGLPHTPISIHAPPRGATKPCKTLV